ncbi:unnamed protein product [Darwinula stevensoni]|uniref:Uncharacterized protein n=1 Tax=Darwinula stevensoni TaxID=69355 RepID=A0A7R9FPE4_9CRUS|nr:unnamed protein product [Darwinula stevensoni]CAG0897812.1 unnamed protein product [Darwinula stevensoni]
MVSEMKQIRLQMTSRDEDGGGREGEGKGKRKGGEGECERSLRAARVGSSRRRRVCLSIAVLHPVSVGSRDVQSTIRPESTAGGYVWLPSSPFSYKDFPRVFEFGRGSPVFPSRNPRDLKCNKGGRQSKTYLELLEPSQRGLRLDLDLVSVCPTRMKRMVDAITSDDVHARIETGSGSLEVSRELLIQTDLAVVSLNFGLGCPGSPFITGHWRYGDREETNGVMLATGHNDGAIRIWHSISGRLLLKLADHTGPVTEVAFAPDQSMRLVSASKDKTLKVWDLTDDGNMFKTLRGHVNGVTMCAWCPSGRLMASVGSGKKVIMWDMEEYGMRWNSAAHHNQIKSCQFSPDGAFLLTASYDTRVLVLDTATGQLLRTLFHVWPMPSLIYASGSNSCWIRSVTISPEGTGIVTVADDGLVRLWDLGDETSPAAVFPVEAQMSCCRYSPKQNLLAVVSILLPRICTVPVVPPRVASVVSSPSPSRTKKFWIETNDSDNMWEAAAVGGESQCADPEASGEACRQTAVFDR